METNNQKPNQQEYTIKIIPHQGETVHSIRLPLNVLKLGAAVLGAGSILLAGAFGYSAYSALQVQESASEIQDLQQVNSIQQEQLLQLAGKANELQAKQEELSRMEDEIRRLAGTAATPGENEHDGQGGPYPTVQPDAHNISQSLAFLEKSIASQEKRLAELREQVKEQREKALALNVLPSFGGANAFTPSIWPASGEVSSPYGYRWNGSDFHPGMDIANDMGTPIVATADGIVTTAGWNSGGYGNMVDIDHGNGIMTRYGHASQVVVSAGQQVRKGQLIACMGSTGFSTGPHVHYEVHVSGQAVNPVSYL